MQSNDLSSLLFFAIPLGFLAYVFLTQRRRVRAVQQMQDAIVVGDEIRTTSGLFGRVTGLTPAEVTLEIAPGVVVRFDRRAIDTKLAPAAEAPSADGPAQEA